MQQFSTSGLNTVLTDNPDFLVVGVIGMQGTGKSSLLNHLANHLRPGATPSFLKTNRSENKENAPNNGKNENKTKSDKFSRIKEKNVSAVTEGTTITSKDLEEVFREQSFEKQMLAEHCTSGIKAWISPTTRVIFLDSQPLNSISVLGNNITDFGYPR